MPTSKQVADQFFNPLQPFKNLGYATGVIEDEAPSTWETFSTTPSQGRTPVKQVDLNDPEAKAQLEFYAAMSGMTLEEYIAAMEADPDRGKQAPQLDYERQMANSPEGRARAAAVAREAAATGTNTAISDSNAREAADVSNYWSNNVDTALGQQRSAVANQQTANRMAETELRGGGDTLNNLLSQTQGQRTAGINSANSAQQSAMNDLVSQNSASNNQLTSAASGLNSQLSGISSNQSAANTRLGSQLNAINANQSAANSALGSQLSNSNNQAWAATDQFSGQMNAANYDQNLARQRLGDELYAQSQRGTHYVEGLEDQTWALNAEDQAATQRYLEQTNPLLAEQRARGSDERYVKQQQDIFDEYKALSNPEVNAQERFLAELARRKTESSDKSSRDATYEAMKQRGLNSGGQQIAAQLANRQATSQDRVLAELGISASAIDRSERNRAGATGVAAQLRNADDGMRQFQDQYAQNDAQRRQSVMQGQADTQMRSTAQRGDRSGQLFNAQRANLNDATNRTGMTFDADNQSIAANAGRNAQVFDATSSTINSNSNRDVQRFDATTTTNNANSGRNISAFDATTATNAGNTQRAGMGFDATRGAINDNSNRNATSYDARTGTINSNFDRSAYGWDTGDSNARTGYDVTRNNTALSTQNRANEVGSAAGLTGSSLSAAQGYAGIRGTQGTNERTAAETAWGRTLLGQVENDEDEN